MQLPGPRSIPSRFLLSVLEGWPRLPCRRMRRLVRRLDRKRAPNGYQCRCRRRTRSHGSKRHAPERPNDATREYLSIRAALILEREPAVPPDLRKALAAAPSARARWNDLTPIARRDFISWIDAAKQSETRNRRIERTCSMIAEGKRRPCCFAIVPLNLHKALTAAPKAKAQWSDLTPTERRDFISWIDSAKQSETRTRRIEKACAILASGKRRP